MLSHEKLTYAIIGAAMEVHKVLGCGFLEAVYQEAMELEMGARGLKFVSQPEMVVTYKGKPLKHKYRPDFLVEETVVVELKAISALTATDEHLLFNYLRGTRSDVGLIINFGENSLKWKRAVMEAVNASAQSATSA
jgi:GxxExxY protein